MKLSKRAKEKIAEKCKASRYVVYLLFLGIPLVLPHWLQNLLLMRFAHPQQLSQHLQESVVWMTGGF